MEIIHTILSLIAVGLSFSIIAGVISFLICLFLIYRAFKTQNKMRSEFKKRRGF